MEGSETLTPTTIEALTYTYDKGGNRITQVRQNAAASNLPTAVAAVNIAYDAANELTRWNSATTNLTYDNNGNLATETQGGVTTTYTWDARNRLTGISRTGLTASFIYDGVGRRNSKTINDTTTGFWYDGDDVFAELTGATPSATYIRGLSIDEPYIRKGVSDEFYEADALGSSLVLTDPAGASQTTYTYEPFGVTTQVGPASSNVFQYTGRENDGMDLYYFRARYYSSRLQRFRSEDPIGFQGESINLYTYVWNNPFFQIDPWGLRPGDPFRQEHLAAMDAFDYICQKPLKRRKWEWGGFIEKRADGFYYASEPVTDSKTYTVDPQTPMRSGVTAEYHSHSSATGKNEFSPKDYLDSRTGQLFANYLGSPDCQGIQKYHPGIGKFPIR